jgi:hypothetical protein
LIHALCAYYHSRAYSKNWDSFECSHYSSIEDDNSEHSNGSDIEDDERNHPNQEPNDQMSDITSIASAGDNGLAMENSSPVLHSKANPHESNDNIDTEEEDDTFPEEHCTVLQNANENDSQLLDHCVNEMDVSSDQVDATKSTTEEEKKRGRFVEKPSEL